MLPLWLIWSPDTLPDMALTTLVVWVRVSSAPFTSCCEEPIVAFSRCWLSAVVTISVNCVGCAMSAKSRV